MFSVKLIREVRFLTCRSDNDPYLSPLPSIFSQSRKLVLEHHSDIHMARSMRRSFKRCFSVCLYPINSCHRSNWNCSGTTKTNKNKQQQKKQHASNNLLPSQNTNAHGLSREVVETPSLIV